MTAPRWWVRPEPEDVEPPVATYDKCPRCKCPWHGLRCQRSECTCESAWEASA